jgi:hypothetical protein
MEGGWCPMVKNSRKYLLMGQRFDRGSQHFKFCLMEIETQNEFEWTAVEIARDPKLISGLHAQDAFKIGYVLANEAVKHEFSQYKDGQNANFSCH